ncbi:MAG: hypothetical protein IPM74_12480 [Crocinitomicaceae bacterium]|nr:hypothetical protein [Crocinitomicaceae bacterium]MBK8926692.1 hypothetical protein [Crocinitomicaceae bacterium]
MSDSLILCTTLHFSYSETGKLMELEQRNNEGDAVRNTIYYYNENDNFEGHAVLYDGVMYEYSELKYNELGLCLSKNIYDKYYDIKDTIVFKYNNKNQLVEESQYLDIFNSWYGTYFRYDEAGNRTHIIKGSNVDSSEYDSYIRFDYGTKNELVKETQYKRINNSLVLDLYRVHDYDENGYNIKTTTYFEDGTIGMELFMKYNVQGKVIEIVQLMEQSYVREKRLNFYNENGQLIESQIFNDECQSKHAFWVYDE